MAKAGVETDVSQQFRNTGVETGQQFLLTHLTPLVKTPLVKTPLRLNVYTQALLRRVAHVGY